MPPQLRFGQGVKLGRAGGLRLLPPLPWLALEEQCCGTPASHPAAVIRGAAVIGAPQLAADLEDAVAGPAICFDALSCCVEGGLVKGHTEPWAGA